MVHGKRAITANTAEQFWMNLQMRYARELEKDLLGDKLEKEVEVYSKN
jgi:plasmid maintenance system antidote protein VapI